MPLPKLTLPVIEELELLSSRVLAPVPSSMLPPTSPPLSVNESASLPPL